MNRQPSRRSPKQPPSQKRRATQKEAALPKGAKEFLRQGAKGKTVHFQFRDSKKASRLRDNVACTGDAIHQVVSVL